MIITIAVMILIIMITTCQNGRPSGEKVSWGSVAGGGASDYHSCHHHHHRHPPYHCHNHHYHITMSLLSGGMLELIAEDQDMELKGREVRTRPVSSSSSTSSPPS